MADTQIADTVAKTFVVDADDVVGRIVELVKPTAKSLAREKRKSLWIGVLLGAVLVEPVCKGITINIRKHKAEKQNNDGLTN